MLHPEVCDETGRLSLDVRSGRRTGGTTKKLRKIYNKKFNIKYKHTTVIYIIIYQYEKDFTILKSFLVYKK